jgi:cobalt-zinc-cadmium efflux system protein
VAHSHAHAHGAARGGARHRHRLAWSLGLLAVVFVVELVAGIATSSLALVSDAGHVLTDAAGIGMALAAIHLASRSDRNPQRTFGLYRLEILAALVNAVLLVGVSVYVVWEALARADGTPDIPAGPLAIVAAVGLAANVAVFLLLREGARESLNVEGAYLEVLADLAGSVATLAAAGVIATTGWDAADTVVGVAVGVVILPRASRLAARALRILLQAAPPDVDLARVHDDLATLPGVVDVHDLHVWTLTSDMEVASAHLMVGAGTDPHVVLDAARELLRARYHVAHATLQVEPDDHTGCEEIDW